MKALDSLYGRFYPFDVLAGISTTQGSRIKYFYQDGRHEDVKKYKAIGTGAPFGSIYLKRNWNSDMSMNQVAELGYFIIRYVERFQLDLTVGTGEDRPHPQIILIPDRLENDRYDYPPSAEDFERYEDNTQERLKRIEYSSVHDYTLS
jgi:hypothetical protein